MELIWLDRVLPSATDLAGAAAVLAASNALDAPHLLAETTSVLSTLLVRGWDGEPPDAAVLRDDRGRVVGVVQVHLPRWDNRHLAIVDVAVDPALRRHGLGRRLFGAAVARARTDGRSVIVVQGWDRPHATGFAAAVGLERASEEAQRRLDVWALDRTALGSVRTEATQRAAGYELLRVPGAVPAPLLPGLLRVTESINDAPLDDLDIEDEVATEQRLRAFEAAQQAMGRRIYRVVARQAASGELAGHTLVCVDAEHPWCGWQLDTSVLAVHRGHRLGLLLKVELLDWLAEAEPQLRSLDTWNAVSNPHMEEVNERVGFRLVGHQTAWQLRL